MDNLSAKPGNCIYAGRMHGIADSAPTAQASSTAVAQAAYEANTGGLAGRSLPAGVQVGNAGRTPQEITEFVIEHMERTVDGIRQSEPLRTALNKVAQTAKGMSLGQVEIKVYSPFFKELGKARGVAVSEYLKCQGVDDSLIQVTLRGPGHKNKDYPLATASGVRIEVYGHPKMDPQLQQNALRV